MVGIFRETDSPSPKPSSGGADSDPVADKTSEIVSEIFSSNWWIEEFLPIAFRVAVIVVLGIIVRQLLVRLINKTVQRMSKNRRQQIEGLDSDQVESVIDRERDILRAETVGNLLSNVASIAVFSFAGLLLLTELGFDVGPLIAGAGFVGVALGFGAQSLVADFMNGIFMTMEDQFGVGDIVRVVGSSGTDSTGTVEKVSLRTTQIRGIDGTLWFVRNGEVMSTGNMSQDWSRGVLDIGISYRSDVIAAKEAMTRVGEGFVQDPQFGSLVLQTPEVWGVQELAADSVVIRMVIKTRPGDHWSVGRELRERIKYAFEEAGIEIPYPQRTVWLRREPGDWGADSVQEHANPSKDNRNFHQEGLPTDDDAEGVNA